MRFGGASFLDVDLAVLLLLLLVLSLLGAGEGDEGLDVSGAGLSLYELFPRNNSI